MQIKNKMIFVSPIISFFSLLSLPISIISVYIAFAGERARVSAVEIAIGSQVSVNTAYKSIEIDDVRVILQNDGKVPAQDLHVVRRFITIDDRSAASSLTDPESSINPCEWNDAYVYKSGFPGFSIASGQKINVSLSSRADAKSSTLLSSEEEHTYDRYFSVSLVGCVLYSDPLDIRWIPFMSHIHTTPFIYDIKVVDADGKGYQFKAKSEFEMEKPDAINSSQIHFIRAEDRYDPT